MAKKSAVKLTRHFERNLEEVERFLAEADAPQSFDQFLDDLADSVIPNLERFPDLGRLFLARQPRSVEASGALERLQRQMSEQFTESVTLREYILASYLILYASQEGAVYLLATKHHRQLSFDFESHWSAFS